MRRLARICFAAATLAALAWLFPLAALAWLFPLVALLVFAGWAVSRLPSERFADAVYVLYAAPPHVTSPDAQAASIDAISPCSTKSVAP